jgi:hypothetical protein
VRGLLWVISEEADLVDGRRFLFDLLYNLDMDRSTLPGHHGKDPTLPQTSDLRFSSERCILQFELLIRLINVFSNLKAIQKIDSHTITKIIPEM